MNTTLSEPASSRPRRRRRLQDAQRLGLRQAFVRPALGIGLGMLAALAIVLGMWLYHANEDFSPPAAAADDSVSLEERQASLADLSAQYAATQAALTRAEARLQQEQDSQRDLLAQLSHADADNRQLKLDLAAFEEILPMMGSGLVVHIGSFQAERTDAGQVRYRLLVAQGGRQSATQPFKGELQLLATDAQGKGAMMVLPVDNQPAGPSVPQALEFSHYQRVEGLLDIPEGVEIKSLRARVVQNGRVRAEQSVHL